MPHHLPWPLPSLVPSTDVFSCISGHDGGSIHIWIHILEYDPWFQGESSASAIECHISLQIPSDFLYCKSSLCTDREKNGRLVLTGSKQQSLGPSQSLVVQVCTKSDTIHKMPKTKDCLTIVLGKIFSLFCQVLLQLHINRGAITYFYPKVKTVS